MVFMDLENAVETAKECGTMALDTVKEYGTMALGAVNSELITTTKTNTNNVLERLAYVLDVQSPSMPLIAGMASSCIVLNNTMQNKDVKENSYLNDFSLALAAGLGTHIFVDNMMNNNPSTSVVGLGALTACIVANGLFNQMMNLFKIDNASIDVMSLLSSCFIGVGVAQLGGQKL